MNPDGPQKPYITASYLAEIHPEQHEALEEVLARLGDHDPVKVSLGMLLGADFYVDFDVCTRCGAIVHDQLAHGTWHDWLDSR